MAAPKPDHWTPAAYQASASFVPHLTTKIVQWLDPQSGDDILDIGCGDGELTSEILTRCHSVVGLDSSLNFIKDAQDKYRTTVNLHFEHRDCTILDRDWKLENQASYDKVFSNAALHWILRDPTTRLGVLEAAYAALKPGGTFVFEMGGAGNVAEVHTALIAALVHQGVGIEKAREASPWYFPSEEMMREMLVKVGFTVEKMELEYRPTRLTEKEGGGLEGWVRLFGAALVQGLDEEGKEKVIREVVDVLETVVKREGGEGGYWLGYVRLRVLARK